MLSTVYAAEAQFRHDTEARAREHAVLGSIRDRRDALASIAKAHPVRRPVTRREVAWARPIGVKLSPAQIAAA